MAETQHAMPKEVLGYYDEGREAQRLFQGIGPLELARTQELIERCFPPPPAVVLDVGGGPGVYAAWLAQSGYEVHLIDAVPLHVDQARQASIPQPGQPASATHPAARIASIELGDARRLDHANASADAVLLLGPLYHLTEQPDRLAALSEARRVLRPGGVLLAAGISRHASLNVSLARWWLGDAGVRQMIRRELSDGQHRPPANWPGLFTTAFFHHPDELRAEVEAAGLVCEALLAVEATAWLAPDIESLWQDPVQRELLLAAIRWVEQEPALMGLSPHIMAVARTPG